jgi:hypothetical protein
VRNRNRLFNSQNNDAGGYQVRVRSRVPQVQPSAVRGDRARFGSIQLLGIVRFALRCSSSTPPGTQLAQLL